MFNMDFFRDFMFLLAGLASVLQYRLNGTEKLAAAIVAYNMIAIIFQMFSHIWEKKFPDSDKGWKLVVNLIVSFGIAFAITQLLVPVPTLKA